MWNTLQTKRTPGRGRREPASSWYASWRNPLNICQVLATSGVFLQATVSRSREPSMFRRLTTTNGRKNSARANGNGNGNGSGDSSGSAGNSSGGAGNSSGSPGNSTATSTISSSEYARRCRELVTLNKDLRALGANTFFDLPNITVIGGQSAGKSSLVEAVSGINVPRDSGTCTRCPMECTLSSSAETWWCKISLRFDYNGLGAKQETITHAFGPTIIDRSSVELWLRRAQAAILHPHLPYQNFCAKTEQELRNPGLDDARLQFSKNAVLVELSDPLLTDLSFVDLPGLIQNESNDIIEVVRDLAVDRIASKNTIILVTIPMSDDLQNQQAARLAKDADDAGERTIAVLTKPDMLGPGATGLRQTWKDVLDGTKYSLKHGYYCVRLPDDDERSRGISRTESERRAAEYFDSTQPWRDVADRSRFGVTNLAAFLSKLLVDLIETNLPELRQQLNALLNGYNEELLQLPPPPVSEPAAEVLLRVTAFCRTFNAAVLGDSDDHKSLAQKHRRRYLQFKAEIRSTGDEPGDDTAESGPLDLLDVRRVIEDSIGWELPNYVPFGATKALVLRFTSQWRAPSISCFEAIVEASSELLDQLMSTYFSQFTKLEDHIRNLTHAELESCKEQAMETLEKMLEFEKLPLFTQNTHLFQSETHAWLTRYTAVSNGSSRYLLTQPAPTRAYILGDSIEGPFTEELNLMAKVRAYWQIAYQRVIDYVPLLIEHEFNQRLGSRLEEVLFENLLQEPNASARMRDLLTEDPSISARRNLLERQIARLSEMKRKLDGLS